MIPIYRAKKIDIDEWVEGYLSEHHHVVMKQLESILYRITNPTKRVQAEIDPNTLAIHFPNMIDKNGKKIFASLSEDGVGGDIVDENGYHRKGIVRLYDGSLEIMFSKNHKSYIYKNQNPLEVIGIHKGVESCK